MNLRFVSAAIVAALISILPARATIVLPVDLDALIARAAVAFEGTVTGNRVERDAATNLVVTYTTFAVHDVLKGDAGSTYTIKQVGGDLDDGGTGFRIQGVPRFAEGREYVVFIPAASQLGFASPVGLAQGRFHVKRERDGAKVGNGRDFRELTANIPSSGRPEDPVERARRSQAPMRELDLADFKELVRRRVRETK